MAADYAMRMQQLRLQHQEMAARRAAIEKKLALREATAAEFSAVALQTARQRVKSLKTAAAAARKRNDEFVREVRAAQRRVEDARLQVLSERAPASVALAREKARYLRRIEQVYPVWQEKEQRMRIDKLRALEERKRAVEQRRFLAKKTFEQEQTVEDLIRQTRHEIELAESLAQNEAYERELLRQQSSSHAAQVKKTIREHARGARSYLQTQASDELLTTPGVDEQTTDAIYEAFSPRSALNALREGVNIVSMHTTEVYGNDDCEFEERQHLEVSAPSSSPFLSSQYGLQTIQEDDESLVSVPEILSSSIDSGLNRCNFPPVFETKNASTHMQASATHPPQAQQNEQTVPYFTNQGNAQDVRRLSSGVSSVGNTTHFPMPTDRIVKHAAKEEEKPIVSSVEANEKRQNLQDLHQTPQYASQMEVNSKDSIHFTQMPNTATMKHEEATAGEMSPARSEMYESKATLPPESYHQSQDMIVSSRAPGSNAKAESLPQPVTVPLSDLMETKLGAKTSTKIEEVRTIIIQADPTAKPHETQVLNGKMEGQDKPFDTIVEKSLLPSSTEEALGSDTAPMTINQNSTLENKQALATWTDISTAKPPSPVLPTSTQLPEVLETGTDSIQLSPLTSLELSGSFFRDVEARGVYPPSSVETVESKESALVKSVPMLTEKNEVELSVPVHLPSNLQESTRSENHEGMYPVMSHESSFSADLDPADPPSLRSMGIPSKDQDVTRQPSPVGSPADTSFGEERDVDTLDIPLEIGTENKNSSPLGAKDHALPPRNPAEMSGKLSIASTQQITQPVINEAPATIEQESPIVTSQAASETLPKRPPTEGLSASDRIKALTALMARVEEGATEGDQFGGSMMADASNESKRDLVRSAVSGRKAQVAFYGSDICFELIVDIARDIGMALFPPRAFEGIMNDQKLRKLHQQSKEKEMDTWKLYSNHMKQLVTLKAVAIGDLVEIFLAAFLSQDPNNQRSQRKMREFLYTTCGATATESPPRKDSFVSPTSSPNRLDPGSGPASPVSSQPLTTVEETKPQEIRVNTPSVLQTAFLQHQSPPKSKTFGIATSGYKKKAGREADFLSSMSSTPTRLSQKLIKGGKLGDYSEFEEEDEVDLQNLIGSRSARTPVGNRSEAPAAAAATTTRSSASSFKASASARRGDDDFDVDF